MMLDVGENGVLRIEAYKTMENKSFSINELREMYIQAASTLPEVRKHIEKNLDTFVTTRLDGYENRDAQCMIEQVNAILVDHSAYTGLRKKYRWDQTDPEV